MQSNLLTTLSVKSLKQAVAIRERIDVLQRDLDRIFGAQAAPVRNSASRKGGTMSAAARASISKSMKARWAKRKRNQRVSSLGPAKATKGRSRSAPLKEQIVQNLKSAGKTGVTVKDLAAKLGKSYGNINVWFHTTAKGINQIKKIEPGRFSWAS